MTNCEIVVKGGLIPLISASFDWVKIKLATDNLDLELVFYNDFFSVKSIIVIEDKANLKSFKVRSFKKFRKQYSFEEKKIMRNKNSDKHYVNGLRR